MRILFITATRVGDAVLSTGLLSYLVQRYPDAGITIAVGGAAAPLFEPVPGLDRLIVINKEPFGLHWLKLWRQCVGRRWDLVVDLRRSALGWLLLAGRRRIAPKSDGPRHRVELLAETLGLQNAPPAPHVWIDTAHKAAAAEIIPSAGPVLALAPAANWRVLALAPAANWRGKQWRPERFAELAERLTAPAGILPGARIAIFAAANERGGIAPVLSAIPADRLIDTVGRIDLSTIAACLKRCSLFIGNDSGLMHLAAACDIPTLGLFGPSREEHYAPWGDHCAWVRTKEDYETLTGGPDYDHRTTGTLMDGLSVGRTEQAAKQLWQRVGKPSP
jgi:ADP-heptose:LPS heptosyltransferase